MTMTGTIIYLVLGSFFFIIFCADSLLNLLIVIPFKRRQGRQISAADRWMDYKSLAEYRQTCRTEGKSPFLGNLMTGIHILACVSYVIIAGYFIYYYCFK